MKIEVRLDAEGTQQMGNDTYHGTVKIGSAQIEKLKALKEAGKIYSLIIIPKKSWIGGLYMALIIDKAGYLQINLITTGGQISFEMYKSPATVKESGTGKKKELSIKI